MSKTDHQLRLATGRLLAYDEHGAADGTPIFYFHGSPSTRLEWHLFGSEALARKLDVRVIVPDRPASAAPIFSLAAGSAIGPQM
jgi:pimeloyl-ACP methyl ester carboxylesterase